MPAKSRQQRRARARSPLRKKRRGTISFMTFLLVVLIGGGTLIAFTRFSRPPITRGAIAGEHWHASYKIFICGKRVENYPTVEGELHSHGDGFIHIHPSTPAATGENATLATFLRLYETNLSADEDGKRTLTFPDGTSYSDGDRCKGSKKRHNIEVTNKGKKVEGDPGLFLPHDGDVVEIKFGPEGKKTMKNPYSKVNNLPSVPTGPNDTPAPDGAAPQQQVPVPSIPVPSASAKSDGGSSDNGND